MIKPGGVMRLSLIVAVAALLVACVTGERVHGIRIGMGHPEVISVMGEPDGVKAEGAYESYQYANRLMSGWSWDRADYQVIFRDGKVVEYGAGTIRQDQSHNTLVLIPLR